MNAVKRIQRLKAQAKRNIRRWEGLGTAQAKAVGQWTAYTIALNLLKGEAKSKGDRCPTCGTVFAPESMHPFDVEVREQVRERRSHAAKKGWKRRKRDKVRVY